MSPAGIAAARLRADHRGHERLRILRVTPSGESAK
jgi:hypothetical protein